MVDYSFKKRFYLTFKNLNHIINELKKRIQYLINHPISYPVFLINKIKGKLTTIPDCAVMRRINRFNYVFALFNIEPRMPKLYLGLYHVNLNRIFKKYIKKGDIIVDVGANFGYTSARGAKLVGKTGEIHSFEPVPKYFLILSKLAELNPEYKFFINNYALGDTSEVAEINLSNDSNIGYNTLVPDLMEKNIVKKKIQVEIHRLDEYLSNNNIENVSFIKIDVEGYEFPVLKGLSNYFENNRHNLPNILVEIDPKGSQLLGLDLKNLKKYMSKYSYKAYTSYREQEINIEDLTASTDVLFKPKE